MAITLRPYQKQAFDAIRKDWEEGGKRTMISMPTGTGKTWIFVFLIYAARQNGHKCMVVVNRDTLVDQTVDKLGRVGVAAGVVKGHRHEWRRDVVVASVQSLSKLKRLRSIPKEGFKLIILDECHFSAAKSYQRLFTHFFTAWFVGFTATAFRGDKKSLAKFGWHSIPFVYSYKEAAADNWLVPVKIAKVNTNISLDGIKVVKDALTEENDFSDVSLAWRLDTPERNKAIAEAYLEHMPDKKVIGFCSTVKHSWSLANEFRKQGVDARIIYGIMKGNERWRVLHEHRNGLFNVLINCNVLTHGYDDPTLGGIIMARPTKSKPLYLQMVGRGLRPCPKKEDCTILDVVDVTSRYRLTVTAEVSGLLEELGQNRAERQAIAILEGEG
ncbi:MAG: DEAD/DEAH box helicase [Planctomycetota bacterium]|jgi:superfamily II DNA or RNA helicase